VCVCVSIIHIKYIFLYRSIIYIKYMHKKYMYTVLIYIKIDCCVID
jgi:hypothetical protein